uniref:Peptidase M50 domain-containing protein n=1 Tax=Trieres chinensis TaxID=1514140 RepID=A0A7S2A296_TRICV|mmetsp:Transcript_38161/g.77871  ORF Transcript_38161/g.77871 Transcript_38161/m.77871 type:complete len:840 (+) Transcript_38161:237-2756(+)
MSAPPTPAPRRCRPKPGCTALPAAVAMLLLSGRPPCAGAFRMDGRVPHRRAAPSSPMRSERVISTANGALDIAARRKSLVTLSAGGDADQDDADTPFFARLADRFLKQPEKEDEKDTAAAVAVVEKPPPAEDVTAPPAPKTPEEIAADFRAQAERARLEAERMDAALTLDKIEGLEKRLESKSLRNRPEEEADLRRQLRALTDKLNGVGKVNDSAGSSGAAVTAAAVAAGEEKKQEEVVAGSDPMEGLPEELKDMDIKLTTTEELYNMIPPMPEDELKARSDAFRGTPKVLQEMTAKAAGFDNADNATAIVEQMYKDEKMKELKRKLWAEKKMEPLDEEAIANALDGYMKLPLPIQDLIAKSVGMSDGRNATAVIKKLEEEGRLFSDDGGVNGFEVDTEFVTDVDMSSLFVAEEEAARDRFIESMIPRCTRNNEDAIPTQEEVDVFFREVLGKDTFNPTEKPMAAPGGFIVYGENRKKTGEELVEAMQKRLDGTTVAERLQFSYMIDPSPIKREELDDLEPGQEKPAVIYVSGRDYSPGTNVLVKPLISGMGLFTALSFSFGTLALNVKAVDQFYAQVDAGVVDFSWLETMAFPLFGGLMAVQLAHEIGHRIIALKDKIDVGLPTFVPSLQLGLTGAITPIKSPPKNINSLFDFAVAGPLAGLVASFALLVVGLESTLYSDAAALAQFPNLPISFVRSSSLVGGIVQGLLGDGILLTPNPALDTIALHPLAVAGFAGLMINSLSLLPLGNTDGGRVCQALFGRSWSRIVTTFTSLFMVLAGVFGLDDANLLLWYSFYASIWQRETEVPCRNEIDDLSTERGLVSIALFVLVMLTLIPMP